MDAVVDVGIPVRYPRTGTVGKVVRIEMRNGFPFAELDTTGMLYRIDLLVPAAISEKFLKATDRDEALRMVAAERRHSRDSSLEEIPNLDSACNGAG